jgi:hypothetical protein
MCVTKTSKPSEKCFCVVWYMIPNVSGDPSAYIRVQRRWCSEPCQETPDTTPGALRVSNLKMVTDY